jgi:peroxiredoxin Q/BCP
MGIFSSTALKPGDAAPDFDLRDQSGKTLKLSGLKGKRVVLFFYPKADTPG